MTTPSKLPSVASRSVITTSNDGIGPSSSPTGPWSKSANGVDADVKLRVACSA